MRKIRLFSLFLLVSIVCYADSYPVPGGTFNKALTGFLNPQDSVRTKMWWFHGKFPSTKEGMTKDLEAFKRIGIGGIVFYDQVHGDQLPGTELAMSKEWWDNVYYVARETERLGLDFEFHVSNGFVAGGPWIKPEDAMKRLESIETVVSGGKQLELRLKVPENKYDFYRDIKVMAIPTEDVSNVQVKISSNTSQVNPEHLFEGQELCAIPAIKNESIYIRIDYSRAKVLRSITYIIGPSGKATTSATNVPAEPQETFVVTGYEVLPPCGELQWSEDGEVYHKVCDLKPLYRAHESYKKKTISFLPVKARFYRIKLSGWNGFDEGKALHLGGIVLSSDPMINEYEYKAGYISEYIEKTMASPAYTSSELIPSGKVLDITHCLGMDGVLRWNAPAGNWRILRLCMVPTGGKVKHGRPEMMGLECDKLSVRAATLQFNSYFKQILDSLDYHGINNLKGMAMDSHEAGAQNWTDDFLAAFKRLRGYDLTPYLPVMAGYVIDDIKTSENVLYDVRLTIADLIAERYYGTFDRLCRKHNVVFTAQATGNAQCIVAISIVAKSKVQKPQGEFWVMQPDGNYDIKESSSAAHLYGKPIASAEAFTDGDLTTMPSDLKNIADGAYAFGINEFVVCASVHQPREANAGDPGGRYYATYSRNNTWWEKSRDFWNYQARVSYVMRQGRPVADLCVYLGNNAPVRILTHRLPKIPAGYDFDVFSEDALLTRMELKEGKIVLPTGQCYSMMVLPRSGEISLDALRKIALLVKQGACVYGNRPTGSPCKKDIGKEDEYEALVHAMWDATGFYGKGRVFSGMTLSEALQKMCIAPDVDGTKLYFAHRETEDCDIYFLDNHTDRQISGQYVFKTKYKYAQLWDAVSGRRYNLPSDKGHVTLHFLSRESCFIVFSDHKENLEHKPSLQKQRVLDNDWTIYFDPRYKGKGTVYCRRLEYWNENEDPAIRYYSGTAVYRTSFEWNGDSTGVHLQIPSNNCVTEVYVNGQQAGTIWCSPWVLDISSYMKSGKNEFELHVTNSWNNRAIDDLGQDKNDRLIGKPELFVSESSILQDAGLQGEVLLRY